MPSQRRPRKESRTERTKARYFYSDAEIAISLRWFFPLRAIQKSPRPPRIHNKHLERNENEYENNNSQLERFSGRAQKINIIAFLSREKQRNFLVPANNVESNSMSWENLW